MTEDAVESPVHSNRLENRRRAILDAARGEFLKNGFERTTIGDIIRISGGSRTTLNEQFGGKAGLFVAVMRDFTSEVAAQFDRLVPGDAPPEAALRAFARTIVATLLRPDQMAIFRIVTSESLRFPEIGTAFFRLGPETADRHLAVYLRDCATRGQLRIDDPEIAARAFLSMILSTTQLRCAAGMPAEQILADSERYLDGAVDIFLAGVAING